MAILKSNFVTKVTHQTEEQWILDNKIKAYLSYGKKCSVIFSSDTGDVTDQVYGLLSNHEIYKYIKLSALATYYIEVEESKIKELLEIVEKIDSTKLKEGKTY